MVSYIYDTPGIQLVKVRVLDADGNEASFTLDVLVKDVAQTTADFEFTVDGGTISFSNLSVVSPNLTSKVLNYTWSFGDTDPENYEAQKDKIGAQNRTYTYTSPGTYIVTLTVVDVDQVTNTKTAEVVVEGVMEEGEVAAEVTEEGAPKEGSLIGTIFKVILYIILIVLLLVMLVILGLLVFLKIQHPDLVFEELIDELKIKLLGMMGVHEALEPAVAEAMAGKPGAAEAMAGKPGAKPEAPAEPAPEEEVEEPAPEPDLSKADAPVPDWLKKTMPGEVSAEPEVIEGEVEEPTPEPIKEEIEPTEEAEPEAEAEFEEVIEEPEVEIEEPTAEPEPEVEPEVEPEPELVPEPEVKPEASVEEAAEEKGEDKEDLNKEEGPVPDWLKNA